MKTVRILFLLAVLSLATMAGAAAAAGAKNDGVGRDADMRILLDTFTALAEEHFAGIARGLRLISVTSEVRSGDWNAMKGLLSELSESAVNPASVWYARPDGRYYTVEKGFTDKSIADRPYFARLMAGNDVMGDLVVTRSNGKRAVVIAVPVRTDGKVTGALGVSVSADKLSLMLQEKTALPGEMVFYALDANGQSALHRDTSRLFAFPSDMGSRTLREAVKEMLSKSEGTVRYLFHGERTVFYKKSWLTGWIFALGVDTGASAGAEVPSILGELEKEISGELAGVDAALAAAAKGLAGTGLRGPEARKILGDLCRTIPHAVDCAAVDGSGRMVTVEPGEYRRFEGADISGQEQVVRLLKTGRPVMSKVIRTVEGFDAVDVEHPVLSPQGGVMGGVSVLIRPESLFSAVAAGLVRGLPIDVWVMQKDGRIVYDSDQEEIGRMLFDDPVYKPFPRLLSLAGSIAKDKSGAGSYQYVGKKGPEQPVEKDAFWTTVGLHGTEWRIVVTHARAEGDPSTKSDLAVAGVKSREDALRDLAGRGALKDALSGQDKEKAALIFKEFVETHYGVYAVQWVDPLGVNRYGYPAENSAVDFDFHSLKTPSSAHILKAVAEKAESSFASPLVEGKEGRFFMVPVFRGDAYLGMVYIIMTDPSNQ